MRPGFVLLICAGAMTAGLYASAATTATHLKISLPAGAEIFSLILFVALLRLLAPYFNRDRSRRP